MGIYVSIKKRKKGMEYLFVDELSTDCYENALFRLSFRYDTLKEEHIDVIKEYLENVSNNLIQLLNSGEENILTSGTHEDRIKALEDELITLSNNVNTQMTKHGTLKITATTNDMDFNKDGTMIKFTNINNGVYSTAILKNNRETEIVLPIGEYRVNIVNSLNDLVDSVFVEVWDNAVSYDNNYTMIYNVIEDVVEIDTQLKYEN